MKTRCGKGGEAVNVMAFGIVYVWVFGASARLLGGSGFIVVTKFIRW